MAGKYHRPNLDALRAAQAENKQLKADLELNREALRLMGVDLLAWTEAYHEFGRTGSMAALIDQGESTKN
jgi:hypothetical protein